MLSNKSTDGSIMFTSVFIKFKHKQGESNQLGQLP